MSTGGEGAPQVPLPLPRTAPSLAAADFVVAPANAMAVQWLERWPDWPGTALALYGAPGCGKTHLAHLWQARSGARFLAPEALRSEALPELVGDATAMVVDDADRAGEEALLHLFNWLSEHRRHLLLAAREPPARWAIGLADLRSRLLAAPAIGIGTPDEALLRMLLVKLFADRQVDVDGEVADYLMARIERSFAGVSEAVARLDAAAYATQRAITVRLAREVLGER